MRGPFRLSGGIANDPEQRCISSRLAKNLAITPQSIALFQVLESGLPEVFPTFAALEHLNV